jgi:hypothetical protein
MREMVQPRYNHKMAGCKKRLRGIQVRDPKALPAWLQSGAREEATRSFNDFAMIA